jgi:hypothetical protein
VRDQVKWRVQTKNRYKIAGSGTETENTISSPSPPIHLLYIRSTPSSDDIDSPALKITLPLFKSFTASSAESHNFPLFFSDFFIGNSPTLSAGLGTEPSSCFETS